MFKSEFQRGQHNEALCIYLTPDGRSPVLETNSGYLCIGYRVIRDVIAEIIERKGLPITDSVRYALEQYNHTIENWIMNDTEVAKTLPKNL